MHSTFCMWLVGIGHKSHCLVLIYYFPFCHSVWWCWYLYRWGLGYVSSLHSLGILTDSFSSLTCSNSLSRLHIFNRSCEMSVISRLSQVLMCNSDMCWMSCVDECSWNMAGYFISQQHLSCCRRDTASDWHWQVLTAVSASMLTVDESSLFWQSSLWSKYLSVPVSLCIAPLPKPVIL